MGTVDGPARNDSEAKRRFLHVLNQTIQVVCPWAIWMASPVTSGNTWSAFTVPAEALKLQRQSSDLYLRSIIRFTYADRKEPPGGRKVSTLYYAHTVADDEALDNERFAWHWHPENWPYPHLHVNPDEAQAGFDRLHVPTGRVFLEQIVDFLIRDLGVEPRINDWERILSDNVRLVSRFATWGGLDP